MGVKTPLKPTIRLAKQSNAAFAVRQHVFKNRFKTLLDFMENIAEKYLKKISRIFGLWQHTPNPVKQRDPRHVFLP